MKEPDYIAWDLEITTASTDTTKYMKQSMQVLTSSESNEWYTPPWLIELARKCMGRINLDPASCTKAQETVKADYWYGVGSGILIDPNNSFQDGLQQNWYGTVWLNPPYGRTGNRSNAGIWAAKLEEEYVAGRVEQAILLVNSAHGYPWYENLWSRFPVICLRDRIRFVNQQGVIGGQSKKAQTLVYFGKMVGRFWRICGHLGRCFEPEE